jgi:PKD repeat protein
MKKKVLRALIFVVFVLVLVQVAEALDYYAYGDSITSGEGVANESEVYISQMVATHDPTKTVDHNTDGSGRYSSWGLANFATHPGNPFPSEVYILFGMNDKHYDETAEFTYLNLEAMYNAYTDKGSDTRILIETLAEDGQGDWSTYANQRARIEKIQNYLDAKSIPYIKIYDAIDSNPGNCYPDEVNMSLMYNSRHPDTEGHRLMGDYIWAGTCRDTGTGVPVARFVSNATSGIVPVTVKFTDQSASKLPLTSYAWDFDNDGTTDSTAQNPSHVYSSHGTYTVKLTVTNSAGIDSEVKTDYITANPVPIPVAQFTGVPTSGFTPQTVQFTDTSTNSPTLWNWTFGDDSSENHTQKNPVHTYTKTGVYTVSLIATNTWGSTTTTKTNYITVNQPVPPVSGFTADVTTGIVPLTVKFTDTSTGTGISAWKWDFNNDGTVDSTVKNPGYTFSTPGSYTVNLSVTGLAGSDGEIKTNFVNVMPALVFPDTRFTVNTNTGTSRLAVTFTDTSTGTGITAWNWSFGDGTWDNKTSSSNPVHEYGVGTWYPTLTITNASGSNTSVVTPERTITVTSATLPASTKTGVYQNGAWYLDNDGSGTWNTGDKAYSFGAPGWTPIVGDWNATGKSYIGVTNGQQWYLDWNGNGVWDGADKAYSFGAPGWINVTGDWNHDGKTEIGVTNGQQWYLDSNGNGAWDNGIDSAYNFGAPGWTPIAGDWNATGYSFIGVTNGQQWYLDRNGNGAWDAADKAYSFGAPGWTPLVGDWNATGKSNIGVTNGQQGYLDWNGNGAYDSGVDKAYSFGAPGWTPIVGDWNGDGKVKIGVTNSQQWYLDTNGNGAWDNSIDCAYLFGAPGWTPVVGKWT